MKGLMYCPLSRRKVRGCMKYRPRSRSCGRQFRSVMSDLLNERVDAIAGEIESVKHACLVWTREFQF